jgi:Kef-type K+ transport system membrane component KefB
MIFFASAIPVLGIVNFLGFDYRAVLFVNLLFTILVVQIVVKLQMQIRRAKRDWIGRRP